MNKIFRIIALLSVSLIAFGPTTAYSSQEADIVQSPQYGPENRIEFDVTYDTESKSYSIAGFSYAQLKYLGMPGLEQIVGFTVDNLQFVVEYLQKATGFQFVTDKQGLEKMTWGFLDAFDTFSITLNNAEICLNVESVKAICLPWNQDTRQNLFGTINDNLNTARIEEWLGVTNVVLNINNSSRVSQSLVINLATLLQVDVSQEGTVSVEGYNTGIAQPEISNLAQTGGIDNATICWSKGNIYTTVNGNSLPQITVYQAGIELVDKALNLGLGNTDPFFASQVGTSISFAGAEHETTSCVK